MNIQNFASAAAVVAALTVGFAMTANAAPQTPTEGTAATGTTGTNPGCPNGQVIDQGTNMCVDIPGVGLGFDMKMAGSSREDHARFHRAMRMEDQQYIASICKMPYKNRSESDKAYCADVLSN